MDRHLDVGDVLEGRARNRTLLWRGLCKRCPRCGGGDVFETWFRMRPRCRRCGYQFEREPGFFLGSWFINFCVVTGVLFALVVAYIGWKAGHPEAGALVPVLVGVGVAVVGPIAFFPWSRTIWAAFDLLMTPLELEEIVAAADALGADGEGPATQAEGGS